VAKNRALREFYAEARENPSETSRCARWLSLLIRSDPRLEKIHRKLHVWTCSEFLSAIAVSLSDAYFSTSIAQVNYALAKQSIQDSLFSMYGRPFPMLRVTLSICKYRFRRLASSIGGTVGLAANSLCTLNAGAA